MKMASWLRAAAAARPAFPPRHALHSAVSARAQLGPSPSGPLVLAHGLQPARRASAAAHTVTAQPAAAARLSPAASQLTPRCQRLLAGLQRGERASLAQAITLVESSRRDKHQEGQQLLAAAQEMDTLSRKASVLYSHPTGRQSFRLGISGPPGAGKSTFIESWGSWLIDRNFRVAALTIDPTSAVTGGSILGDKTRMPKLSANPQAYIRPSPSGGSLGGVTRSTTDAIVLCEAAGFDWIIVETVGVGQSEVAVADMVDMFALLLPPAGGDELQGIKRGIVELADAILINKADGDLVKAATQSCIEYSSALRLLRPKSRIWRPEVMPISSVESKGLDRFWDLLERYRKAVAPHLNEIRSRQYKLWMWSHIKEGLLADFRADAQVSRALSTINAQLHNRTITPGRAAELLLQEFRRPSS